MDVLSDVLRLLRLRASVFFHASFCGAWSVDSSGENKATFHLIAGGTCWLHMPSSSHPIALRGGDLVVFPRDDVHVISASSEPVTLPPHSGVVSSGGEGSSTSLVCGYFEFDTPLPNPILSALPDVVHIRSDETGNPNRIDVLMRFIAAETDKSEPGANVVVDRLSDVLFIQVVRTYMRDHAGSIGLLAGLSDQKISQALQSLHANPELSWTVERLAETACMSRAAFAKRFQELMGVAPMAYVTRWRMQRAHELLRQGALSVASIAERSGYHAEAAFRKAFKQYMGFGPGAVRRGEGIKA